MKKTKNKLEISLQIFVDIPIFVQITNKKMKITLT